MGMWNTVVRYLIGDIPQKKKYRQQANVLASRRKALPKEYGFVLGEICRCLTACGLDLRSDLERYSELLTLMEEGAAAGKSVLEVTGEDVGAFCLDVLSALDAGGREARRAALNRKIAEIWREEPFHA